MEVNTTGPISNGPTAPELAEKEFKHAYSNAANTKTTQRLRKVTAFPATNPNL